MLKYKHFLSQFLKIAFTNFLFFLNLETIDSNLKTMMLSNEFGIIFEVIVKEISEIQKSLVFNATESSHITTLKI